MFRVKVNMKVRNIDSISHNKERVNKMTLELWSILAA